MNKVMIQDMERTLEAKMRHREWLGVKNTRLEAEIRALSADVERLKKKMRPPDGPGAA